jgi:hypothetical protein
VTSTEAVRALVERGDGGGAIWRERWEIGRIVLDEPRGTRLVWERSRGPYAALATDLLATDWKWSPT